MINRTSRGIVLVACTAALALPLMGMSGCVSTGLSSASSSVAADPILVADKAEYAAEIAFAGALDLTDAYAKSGLMTPDKKAQATKLLGVAYDNLKLARSELAAGHEATAGNYSQAVQDAIMALQPIIAPAGTTPAAAASSATAS